MLTILDEHCNNVKVLDVLNQELFQLRMADKETVSDWGVCLSRHLKVLSASFPDHFLLDYVAELKRDHFYGQTSQAIESNGSLAAGGSTGENIYRLDYGCFSFCLL